MQLAPKLQSTDKIGVENAESKDTVKRFIRLTNLMQPLLDKVDERKLVFIPAVELSYLRKEEQKHLLDILTREENFGVSMKQATMLKNMSKTNPLTYEQIDKIITDKVSSTVSSFKVSYKKVQDYFPETVTPKEFEETIMKALEAWFENANEPSASNTFER